MAIETHSPKSDTDQRLASLARRFKRQFLQTDTVSPGLPSQGVEIDTDILLGSNQILRHRADLMSELDLPANINWVINGATHDLGKYGLDQLSLSYANLRFQAVIPDHVYTQNAYQGNRPWLYNQSVLVPGQDVKVYKPRDPRRAELDRKILLRDNTFSDPQLGENWWYQIQLSQSGDWFDPQVEINLHLIDIKRDRTIQLPILDLTGHIPQAVNSLSVDPFSTLTFLYGADIRPRLTNPVHEQFLQDGTVSNRQQIAGGYTYKLLVSS